MRCPVRPVLISLAVIASLLLSIGGGSALAQVPSDLEAVEGAQSNGFVGAGVDRVSGTTTFTGTRSWVFSLTNRSGSPVTSPTVSVDSGYDPTLLYSVTSAGCPTPISSFPIAFTGPSLPSGLGWTLTLQSGVATTFTPGFDSARTMTPLVIPVGGAQQKVTITLRASDPNIENFYVFIGLSSPFGGDPPVRRPRSPC
jgi:hypothetical protein